MIATACTACEKANERPRYGDCGVASDVSSDGHNARTALAVKARRRRARDVRAVKRMIVRGPLLRR